jgi:hypothetical protein
MGNIYWLLDNKIELVGLDVPSVDPRWLTTRKSSSG